MSLEWRFCSVVSAAVLLALAGCEKNVEGGIGCLPGGGRYVTRTAVEASKERGPSFYFDVSGSMPAYGKAGPELGYHATPYRNLLAALLAEAGDTSQLYGFANKIGTISRSQIEALGHGRAAGCAACGSLESRLDMLLARIAEESPSTTSVVVTDLWFKNSEVLDNGAISLGDPIRKIIRNGRAIGVLGFAAPYIGPVFDMPDGHPYAGAVRTRPLFVLIVGQPQSVARFYVSIRDKIFFGGEDVEYHYSLFSARIPDASDYHVRFRVDKKNAVVTEAPVLAGLGITREIPQFDLDLEQVERVRDSQLHGDAPVIGAGGVFDPGAQLPAGILWRGPASVETKMWVLTDTRAANKCGTTWNILSGNDDRVLRLTGKSSGPRRLEIDAASSDFDAIARDDIVLLRYEIKLQEIDIAAGDTGWLKSWSFSSNEAAEVRSSEPALFPTLNLSEFRALLERAAAHELADTCRNSGKCPVLASGAIAFRIR